MLPIFLFNLHCLLTTKIALDTESVINQHFYSTYYTIRFYIITMVFISVFIIHFWYFVVDQPSKKHMQITFKDINS